MNVAGSSKKLLLNEPKTVKNLTAMEWVVGNTNIGVSPKGKATDFDFVIYWFESSYPY